MSRFTRKPLRTAALALSPVLLVTGLLLPASPSSAETDDAQGPAITPSEDFTFISLTEEQTAERDARLFADAEGRPVEEVLHENEVATDFGVAVADLQQLDNYGEAGKTDDGFFVSFKSDIPAEAADLVADVDAPVEITGDAPLTAVERNDAVSAASKAVYAATNTDNTIGVQPRSTILEGMVTSPANARLSITPDVVESLAVQAASEAVPGVPGMTIELDFTMADVTENEVLSGGTALGRGTTNQLACTSAFTVRNDRTGQTGLLTAGHCRNDMNYESRTNVLYFQGSGDPIDNDHQWYSSSESVWNQFISSRSGSTLYRSSVSRVAGPYYDAPIRKYGSVTGGGETRVDGGPYSSTHEDGRTWNGLWLTKGFITEGGDSGGPWFYAGAAYGVHSGWKTTRSGIHSSFTPVTTIESLTDLSVIR